MHRFARPLMALCPAVSLVVLVAAGCSTGPTFSFDSEQFTAPPEAQRRADGRYQLILFERDRDPRTVGPVTLEQRTSSCSRRACSPFRAKPTASKLAGYTNRRTALAAVGDDLHVYAGVPISMNGSVAGRGRSRWTSGPASRGAT